MYIGLTYYVKYNEKGLEEGSGGLWTIGRRYIDLLCYFIDSVIDHDHLPVMDVQPALTGPRG